MKKTLAHNFIVSLLMNYKVLLLYLRGFEFQEKRGTYSLWGAVHGSVTSHEHLSMDSLSPSSRLHRQILCLLSLVSCDFPCLWSTPVTRPFLSLCTGAPGGIVATHRTHAAFCPGGLQQCSHRHQLWGALPWEPAPGSHHEADAD